MAMSRGRVSSQLLSSPSLSSRLRTLALNLQKWLHTVSNRDSNSFSQSNLDHSSILIRKTLDSRHVGISKSAISFPTWRVIKILQEKGFDAYLVGGCVRDLLLRRAPKDFDIITTASLKQIKRNFRKTRIVGRRFPICQVHMGQSILEVSSFSTVSEQSKGRLGFPLSQERHKFDEKDILLWKNSMCRDFTINGLFYAPSKDIIYDYVHGIADLRTCKVRTVIPAHISFKEDCARILRGLRIAARLGWEFSLETEAAIRDLSLSIMTLAKSRLMMELNFMLAYGAAAPSIHLLQKFKLLELLLPFHAAYLVDQRKNCSGQSSSMLMRLLSTADKILSADHPSDCSLWLGLLAFHMALVDNPQDVITVRAFSSILYHGAWRKALDFARHDGRPHVKFIPEILSESQTKSIESILEEVSHLASVAKSSVRAFTSVDALKQALARYTGASEQLDLNYKVLVSDNMAKNVCRLFNDLEADINSFVKERETYDIKYELLKRGDEEETRFVLGKVIMDTLTTEVENQPKPDAALMKKRHNLSELFK